MGSFSPEMMPVTSTLAREFAVYDAWFCAVPSQTFCNRAFFHASTSSGFVVNRGKAGYGKWMDAKANAVPTIFNRLEEKGLSWAVYFDESQVVSLTGFINGPALEPLWKTRFKPMKQFYADVAAGTLPAYAFVEPRLIFDHNDMHPPVPSYSFKGADGKEVEVGGEFRRACGREALERRLHGDPQQRHADRLECHEHHAARHLRRAWRHPRPRAAAARRFRPDR